jgi:hypothetical protein
LRVYIPPKLAHHVVVRGLHFVQEDSPDEIGRAIAGWLERF